MAAPPEFGIGLFGGYSTYAMDLTDQTSATPSYDINGGANFGGGLRIRTSMPLVLSLDYERLTGSANSSGTTNGVSYNNIPPNCHPYRS